MVHKQHEIPVLPADQSRGATVNNCVDVLIHLENVVDDVFSSITSRLNETSKTLQDLKQRAANAQAKVEKLTGATKATQVFSCAQYPGGEKYDPYIPVQANSTPIPFITTPLKVKDGISYDAAVLQEKLQFYHVREHRGASGKVRGLEEASQEDGLGRLPPHLSSVSSLLLYNTTHNPYKKYMVLDPLGVVSGTRGEGSRSRSDTANSGPTLHDAPTTLQDGDHMGLIAKDEYQYLPDLSDLPDLDLPMELPSLPGIANDLLYSEDTGPAIAPSFGIPDLPMSLESPDLPTTLSSSQEPVPPPPPPSTNTETPTPIPPPLSTSSVTSPCPPPPSANAAAPLPPPPPPPLPPAGGPLPSLLTQASEDTADKHDASKSAPAAVSSDVRSDLMKAIQAAGGAGKAKLRSNKDRKMETMKKESAPAAESSDVRSDLMKAIQAAGGAGKANLRSNKDRKKETKKKETAPTAPAGDLMSDLFNRLSQRRKGISGAQKDPKDLVDSKASEGSGGMSTMEKVAALIPPPPVANEASDKETPASDEDWD